MKRVYAIFLAAMLVLSAACVLSFSAGAAIEGDWVTSRRGSDYEDEGSYCPAPGYHYDSTGFIMDPPEYAKNTIPFVQAHTKNAVNLKGNNDAQGNSVNLQFTVLEYAYDGGVGADQWIAICLNSQPMATPGSLEYGEGLCILFRGDGNGSAQVQTFYVDNTTGKGFSPATAFPTVEVPMNDKDQEMYTFTAKYTSGGYVLAVNGYEFVADSTLNKHLDRTFEEGAYVCLIAQTAVMDSKISLAITEWQGDLPTGDDSAAPEEDLREKAPIADSATIEANMPAVLWDSTIRDFRKISLTGGKYSINEDGSFHITAQTLSPYITFAVKNEVSYEASDFPYVAILTRNCLAASSGNAYYCAGNIYAPENYYSVNWEIDGTVYADGWSLGMIDLSDYSEDGWYGRINLLRIGFDIIPSLKDDEAYNNFDVAFIAAFRSPEEARAYTEQYLLSKGYDVSLKEPVTEPPTTAEDTTTEFVTEPVVETLPPEIEDFIETLPEIDTVQDAVNDALFGNGLLSEFLNNDAFENVFSGCRSVIAFPLVSLFMAMAAFLVLKKKDS